MKLTRRGSTSNPLEGKPPKGGFFTSIGKYLVIHHKPVNTPKINYLLKAYTLVEFDYISLIWHNITMNRAFLDSIFVTCYEIHKRKISYE